ncbi:transcriptional regulator [Devosia yakushimensis]|uniref:Transcriptional regulator n=1 Tax=Devosia yakushimensis TaxID=470028 RepID=A0ABQ5UH88_9HYPH|nr:helix-turn-helix transcriptional regulator [Devosia yakushimensis]GLQ11460.1 transcriptional regulator [Devosia yakushimensis]
MSSSIHSPEYQVLRELLAAQRKSQGLTQADVASLIGRPQSFVAKYEGGERRIDVVEFLAIAQALNADPQSLFSAFVKNLG